MARPALEKTNAARERHMDGAQPFPTMRKRAPSASSVRRVATPPIDRGKFDILFACGVSAAFWGAIIFLLGVLF